MNEKKLHAVLSNPGHETKRYPLTSTDRYEAMLEAADRDEEVRHGGRLQVMDGEKVIGMYSRQENGILTTRLGGW